MFGPAFGMPSTQTLVKIYKKKNIFGSPSRKLNKNNKNLSEIVDGFSMFLKLIKIIVLGAFYNKHFLLTHKNEV